MIGEEKTKRVWSLLPRRAVLISGSPTQELVTWSIIVAPTFRVWIASSSTKAGILGIAGTEFEIERIKVDEAMEPVKNNSLVS